MIPRPHSAHLSFLTIECFKTLCPDPPLINESPEIQHSLLVIRALCCDIRWGSFVARYKAGVDVRSTGSGVRSQLNQTVVVGEKVWEAIQIAVEKRGRRHHDRKY